MSMAGTSIGLAIAAWPGGPIRALVAAVASIVVLYVPRPLDVTLQGPFGDELHRAILVHDAWVLGAMLVRLILLFALAVIAARRVAPAPPA
jgi:cytochrome c oxidase assembly factor CtaG